MEKSIFYAAVEAGKTEPGDVGEYAVCAPGEFFADRARTKKTEIRAEDLARIVETWEAGKNGQEPPVQFGHADNLAEGACGWVRDLKIDGGRLVAAIEWSRRGIQVVRDRLAKYFSIAFFGDGVLEHVALVATPVVTGLPGV